MRSMLRLVQRIAVTCALVVVLGSGFLSLPQNASAYSCTSDCNFYAEWYGTYWGAATLMYIRALSCSIIRGCNHLSNELKIERTADFACSTGQCWIEAGHVNWAASGSNLSNLGDEYFWGQNNPNSGYTVYPLGSASSDYYGTTWIEMYNNGGTYGCGYQIVVYNNTRNGSAPQYPYAVNCMQAALLPLQPQWIMVGSNLNGSGGAQAETATYQENYYTNTVNSTPQWSFQTTDPSTVTYPPSIGGWELRPSQSQEGGTWWTGCPYTAC